MREKYIFLMGIGVGIVFTVVVGFFVYNMTKQNANFDNKMLLPEITNTESSENNTEKELENTTKNVGDTTNDTNKENTDEQEITIDTNIKKETLNPELTTKEQKDIFD